ncbi:MAG: hypothetical protein Q7T33_03770 [Dehalococcoidia bacterium]|nr:hypothetical protein [Dehalococcoidia bacterium]
MRFLTLVLGLAVLLLVAVAGASQPPSAQAQAPTVTYMSLQDGDVLAEPAVFIQMCFAQPVNIRDLDKGGDFKFEMLRPDQLGMGLQIVFQLDGFGVAVYPGSAGGETAGEWTFKWRLTNPDTLEPAEGTLQFTVDPGGQPVPKKTPPACLTGGATVAPSPVTTAGPAATGQSTATPARSAAASPVRSAAASPTASPGGGSAGESDDGPDILLLSLLTVGAAGGAAVIALIGYLVRRRVGFWLHRPPPGGGAAGGPQDH